MSADGERFIEDGKGLDYWLWELICDDLDRRDRAADVIGRMHMEYTDEILADKHFDYEAHIQAFNEHLHATLARPDFDAKGYLLSLLEFKDAVHELESQIHVSEDARVERVIDKLAARLGEKPTEEQIASYMHRACRAAGNACDPKNPNNRLLERLNSYSVTATIVFASLREEILLVPEQLRAMLRDDAQRWCVLDGLSKIGPPAMEFANDLFAMLDGQTDRYAFEGAAALASIIRDDTGRVSEVVSRLDSGREYVVAGAASTLGGMGTRAASAAPDCIEKLLALTASKMDYVPFAAIDALGKITRGTDAAVDRLMELSRDEDTGLKAVAISALGHVGSQPDRVVPRLIEAFDDYEEYDPDWCYDSDHGRVADALAEFGPAAAMAVPALIARIIRRDTEDGLDQAVVKALGSIGTAAREALPYLMKHAREYEYDEDDFDDELDYLAVAIRRLKAEARRIAQKKGAASGLPLGFSFFVSLCAAG